MTIGATNSRSATMSAHATRLPLTEQMADAGMILGGPFWREFLGAAQIIFLVFIAASHTLTG